MDSFRKISLHSRLWIAALAAAALSIATWSFAPAPAIAAGVIGVGIPLPGLYAQYPYYGYPPGYYPYYPPPAPAYPPAPSYTPQPSYMPQAGLMCFDPSNCRMSTRSTLSQSPTHPEFCCHHVIT